MAWEGSCHCGAIRFEVDGNTPTEAVECNCSFCRRQGRKWWFVPFSQFRLLTNANAVASYFFGAHRIEHHHCGVCGCGPYSEGTHPHTGEKTAAVNLRCVPAVDIDALPVRHIDGASF